MDVICSNDILTASFFYSALLYSIILLQGTDSK